MTALLAACLAVLCFLSPAVGIHALALVGLLAGGVASTRLVART